MLKNTATSLNDYVKARAANAARRLAKVLEEDPLGQNKMINDLKQELDDLLLDYAEIYYTNRLEKPHISGK